MGKWNFKRKTFSFQWRWNRILLHGKEKLIICELECVKNIIECGRNRFISQDFIPWRRKPWIQLLHKSFAIFPLSPLPHQTTVSWFLVINVIVVSVCVEGNWFSLCDRWATISRGEDCSKGDNGPASLSPTMDTHIVDDETAQYLSLETRYDCPPNGRDLTRSQSGSLIWTTAPASHKFYLPSLCLSCCCYQVHHHSGIILESMIRTKRKYVKWRQ